jgi:hypothetical protein
MAPVLPLAPVGSPPDGGLILVVCVMSSDTYRRLAPHAEQLAQSATKDADRKAWLRIAEDWLDIAARTPPTKPN